MIEIKKSVRDRVRGTEARVDNTPVAHGVGRRKSSVARVWCHRGEGNLVVNGKDVDTYFHTHSMRSAAVFPLTIVPHVARMYNIEVRVGGGGLSAQADAIKLGIARAFVAAHEDIRPVLREHKLLTVDARVKERKKPGQRGARAKFQFVKR